MEITKINKPINPDMQKAKTALQQPELNKFTAYIPQSDADALRLYALKSRKSTSELMREIVDQYLTKLEKDGEL